MSFVHFLRLSDFNTTFLKGQIRYLIKLNGKNKRHYLITKRKML